MNDIFTYETIEYYREYNIETGFTKVCFKDSFIDDNEYYVLTKIPKDSLGLYWFCNNGKTVIITGSEKVIKKIII